LKDIKRNTIKVMRQKER